MFRESSEIIESSKSRAVVTPPLSELRHRGPRVRSVALGMVPNFRFEWGGATIDELEVVDISEGGLCIVLTRDRGLAPGSMLDGARLDHGGRELWRGRAVVVHRERVFGRRLGLAFVDGTVDVQSLALCDQVFEIGFGRGLLELGRESFELPAPWRAGVAGLRQLFELLASSCASFDRRVRGLPMRESTAYFPQLSAHFLPHYRRQLELLDAASQQFESGARRLAVGHAQRELATVLGLSNLHSSSRGHSVGTVLMGMREPITGASESFRRFLPYLFEGDATGDFLRARANEAWVSWSLVDSATAPVEIVVCSAGRSAALCQTLASMPACSAEIEITILDGRPWALALAQSQIRQTLAQRRDRDRIKVAYYRAGLAEIADAGQQTGDPGLRAAISGADFICAEGLLDGADDKMALRLLRALKWAVADDGQCFVGALARWPDSAWLLEFGLGVELAYRDRADLVTLCESVGWQVDKAHCNYVDASCLGLSLAPTP